MGFGDSIRMGLSDALNWASEKAEAGKKMVGEAVEAAKDAVVKTAEVVASPLISTAVKEAPKPASLSTTVQGVNSSFTDKVAYAWKKTTEMTSALGTYAAMLSPVAGGAVVASKLISLGNNTYQNKETGDRVQILDKSKSITSVLEDSAWASALKQSADSKTSTSTNPSINTDRLLSALPGSQNDNRSFHGGKNNELTAHVDQDQWNRIFNDSKDNTSLPQATIDGDAIVVRATHTPESGNETVVEAEVKVGQDRVTHDDKKGNVVDFNAKEQSFRAFGAEHQTEVRANRSTGEVEVTEKGKGYRVVDNKQVWDVANGFKVERVIGTHTYNVYDRSNNLIQTIDKDKVTDYKGNDEIIRFTGPDGKICERLKQWRANRKADRSASGLVLGAAEDGIFMRDKDGSFTVLQTDGNAFFELPTGEKIWKNASDKYFIIEAGKAPQEILDGSSGKQIESQAREMLGVLKTWANENKFTRNGVTFEKGNDGSINVTTQDNTALIAGRGGLSLKMPDRPVSVVNPLTNEVTIGEGNNKSTVNAVKEEVDTPEVHTDRLGTTLKSTGDFVSHQLEVKMADGTHFDLQGNVSFADGTVFHASGEVTVGNNAKLAADIQEQQIKQAATVLRNAEAVAEAAKAKAASGLISLDLIAQLEGSISQVGALMQLFSGNDAVRARLAGVMASLEGARNDARTSFAANTALRATRDAALATNKVKPETVSFSNGYKPELKMQFRFSAAA
ncbi:MAG: hypothetical protein DKT66_01580 [Candidatus Melainabacteria bacterium]|nr:MAG: hypothetical protein DKT66_01580 [Candidatus Melainabacteria bacterium]